MEDTKKKERVSLKKMGDPDNPYEKGLREGVEALSNQELLAVLLRTGTRERNVLELSNDLLQFRGGGLSNLTILSMEELTRIPGIGKVKALQLKACAEMALRLSKRERRSEVCLSDPSSIASYCMPGMTNLREEVIRLVYFDTKLHLLGEEEVSTGSRSQAYFDTGAILTHVFRRDAAGFVMLHNHPSGDPTPSTDDEAATLRLREASRTVGVSFFDHIIIGDHTYYSFCEHGKMNSREAIG